MTAVEELAQLNAAITAIETGAQEYEIAGRKLRRGDLEAMYRERRRLKTEVNRESRGGLRVRGVTKTS